MGIGTDTEVIAFHFYWDSDHLEWRLFIEKRYGVMLATTTVTTPDYWLKAMNEIQSAARFVGHAEPDDDTLKRLRGW